jgi:fucose permease
MSGMQAVTAAAIGGAFVCGLALALLGSLKLALARQGQVAEGRVRSLFAALNLALVPMMLLAGVVIDRWGPRGVILASSVLLALGLLALSVRPAPGRAFAALLVAGLGGAGLSIATTVLMPRAFFPAEPAASVNLGMVFFALGALVAPAGTDVLLRLMGERKAIVFLAFVCLLPAFPAAVADAGTADAAPAAEAFGELLGREGVWLAGLVFFFYAPLEAAVAVWTTAFLTHQGRTQRPAGWLAAFWSMFLLARLLTALAQHAFVLPMSVDGWVLVLPPLLAAVALGNLAGTPHPGAARFGLLILGLLLGPVLPTLLGIVLYTFPPEQQGTACGLLYALGSLGSLALSPLFPLSTAGPSLRVALRIPLFLALALTAAALVFRLTPM